MGQQLEWQFLQCFGERQANEEIQEADIISAIEFDHTGQHLATGDRGGRVVLFERVASPAAQKAQQPDKRPVPVNRAGYFEYRYLTEFQSHEPEFDYLKSLEIEEKINKVRWVHPASHNRVLLSTNDKTIKLWKVFDKKVNERRVFNLPGAGGMGGSGGLNGPGLAMAQAADRQLNAPLRLPRAVSYEVVLSAQCRRVFSNAHAYHINSIAINSDQETFISADDLRVNLWNLEVTDQSFNIVDIKPANMEDLTEVITSADFHPSHCNVFAYSSSKGCIRMADMRSSALCDKHSKIFEEQETGASRSFFSEIIASISDIKFSRDGRYILSRDYMTLKLWDVNMESAPVATFPVHEHLRQRLCDLYENDCIFDKFDCCLSGDGQHVVTGSYSNLYRVFGVGTGNDTVLESSRDPLRRRLQAPQRSATLMMPGRLLALKKGQMIYDEAAAPRVAPAGERDRVCGVQQPLSILRSIGPAKYLFAKNTMPALGRPPEPHAIPKQYPPPFSFTPPHPL
eukprot:CAMPEP_0177763542 /NCGR_PEP_ID=MMETSP0491_2-20121128/6927_1 /TAXON_ID=63592 /ORGANISM="Tetraselmis chuii, Strain PLY429" /LENGTH=511 /DNA_ID=CAMNT_0019279657 /DNA_START=495 /DNA_END=2028 /DNA_ORIENTATION=+